MLFCERGVCLSAAVLLLLLLAVALLFCDPVTKLSKEEGPLVVPLAPLVCALFQVDSGTVAMAVSVAVLGFLALLLNDVVVVEGAFVFSLPVLLVAVAVFLCEYGAVIQRSFVHRGELFSFVMHRNQ